MTDQAELREISRTLDRSVLKGIQSFGVGVKIVLEQQGKTFELEIQPNAETMERVAATGSTFSEVELYLHERRM